MKKTMTAISKKFSFLFASMLLSVISFAQDKTVDVNLNTKSDSGSGMMGQPWIWVVGAAVFIIILVAIIRGNSSNK